MTDQIPADKVREILDEWERIKEYVDWEDMDNLVQGIRDLLPTPSLPTLADMTTEERLACKWMQADAEGYESRVVIVNPYWEDGIARVMWPGAHMRLEPHRLITPRPDLPRLEWPGNKKPVPTLPDGWRLADHEEYGRVIVTTTRDRNGNVYFVASEECDSRGHGCGFCDPDELTHIDQEAGQ